MLNAPCALQSLWAPGVVYKNFHLGGGCSRTLSFQRNLKNCSTQIKSRAYSYVANTYVRPIIEYASVVWSPYTQDDISRIEIKW